MPTATLGHVHLTVRDVDRAVDFYADVLGIAVRERHGRFAFLSGDDRHHELALQGVGAGADEDTEAGDEAPPGRVGLYHSAWEVATDDEVAAVYDRLRDRGVDVAPVDHGISRALYFDDPDGNGVEVYRDTRADRDVERWDGRNERFDPHAVGGEP